MTLPGKFPSFDVDVCHYTEWAGGWWELYGEL